MSTPETAARPVPASSARWTTRVGADLALVLVTAIWGATFPVVKAALAHSSPILFNAVRMTLATICLYAVGRPARAIPRGTWAAGAILGLCLAAGYAVQTMGLAFTSPAKSAFITGLSVILVPLMLAAAWRRRVAARVWLATALATAGLYELVFGAGGATGAGLGRGEWLTLAAAACFAAQIVVLGEVAERHVVAELVLLQIGFCALFSWIMLPALEVPRWQPTPGLWLALAVTAILATAVTFSVQAWAQQFTPASRTAVIFSLEPVFGWLASLIGWHEHLKPLQLAGAALIMAGIAAVEWRRGT